ncbi:hypothetical protein [Nonomuraea sp. NPDC050310]|uniref:hypothetical protein n=1 Tax=Nonomuraea sp. NPDC050310 TaxID=3154935 RepID=UPI0033D84BC5
MSKIVLAALLAVPTFGDLTDLVPGGPAARAPYTVVACDSDTTRPGTPPTVRIDPAWLSGGKLALITNNEGVVNPYLAAPPPAQGSFRGTPMCATHLGPDGKPVAPTWVFCLNHDLDACGEAPLVPAGSAGARQALSARDQARLAYVVSTLADYRTPDTRARSARFVWCVTEGRPAGAPVRDAQTYPGLRCPDWTTIDPKLDIGAASAGSYWLTSGGRSDCQGYLLPRPTRVFTPPTPPSVRPPSVKPPRETPVRPRPRTGRAETEATKPRAALRPRPFPREKPILR